MMFEIFKIRKDTNKPQKEPAVVDAISEGDANSPTCSELVSAQEDDFSGVELHEYARKRNIQTGDVWRHIREGRLLARSENGFVYVYGSESIDLPHLSEVPAHAAYHDATELVSFSQNAIERIQNLNDAVIAAKDEVIAEKNSKIEELRSSLEELKTHTSKILEERFELLRRIEDLQILADTVEDQE